MENYKFINKQTGEVLATIRDVLRRVVSDYKNYKYFGLFDWQSTKRFTNKCVVPKLYRVTAVLDDIEFDRGEEWTEDILADSPDAAEAVMERILSERRITFEGIYVGPKEVK